MDLLSKETRCLFLLLTLSIELLHYDLNDIKLLFLLLHIITPHIKLSRVPESVRLAKGFEFSQYLVTAILQTNKSLLRTQNYLI